MLLPFNISINVLFYSIDDQKQWVLYEKEPGFSKLKNY